MLACDSKLVYKNESDGWSCWNHDTCQDPFPFLNDVDENGVTVHQCIAECAGAQPYNFERKCYDVCPPYLNDYGVNETTYHVKNTYDCLKECPKNKSFVNDKVYCVEKCDKWWISNANITSSVTLQQDKFCAANCSGYTLGEK